MYVIRFNLGVFTLLLDTNLDKVFTVSLGCNSDRRCYTVILL
jgi:hypothetical protein